MAEGIHPAKLVCGQYKDPIYALGRVVELLRHHSPFAGYGFGKLTNVLMGQIRRGHFVFTEDDRTAVGYAGWALCDEEAALAWVRQERVPTFEECINGDCWVGITFYAATPQVCFAQARWLRKKYPGMKGYGLRDYGRRERPVAIRNATVADDAAPGRLALGQLTGVR
jgi:hemolysin-activating ACP:hemolysin acyltransferase